MNLWKLTDNKLKHYPHFDSQLSIKEAELLANDPIRVSKHPFYPFIRFHQNWNRFADPGKKGKPKERPIRYAARGDAYIFSRYRHLLSEAYEVELNKRGLSESILAYRRILLKDGSGGKCNIHFAQSAFEEIAKQENCCAIALDISSFFESLDHQRLRATWCRLIGVPRLPSDHYAVFQAITRYSVVDKEEAYARLGHFGPKRIVRGKTVNGYVTPKRDIPKQLCRGQEFREKIAGGDGQPSIIRKNFKSYGIPQGAPISDLLANLYLLEFDATLLARVKALGGAYFRYSDDILVIVPVESKEALSLAVDIRMMIASFGKKLKIKEEKSSILRFWKSGTHQQFETLFDGQAALGRKSLNGLEYLGFRFDGRSVYLRDGTLSNFWRKVTFAAARAASDSARRYSDKDAAAIMKIFDYDALVKRFGRVEDFSEMYGEPSKWTFWTYAQRSSKIFGKSGKPILRQLSAHRKRIKAKAQEQIERAVARR